MKNTKNKTLATIALVLVLTSSAILVALPIVSAHDPAWEIPTYAYIEAFPNPIGKDQQLYILAWLDKYSPTGDGAYGDRWHNMEVTVWKPDGSTEILGPYDSDSVGTIFIAYVPDQIGTCQIQLDFPGQTLTGENPHPTSTVGKEYIGDYYKPSTSEKITITVQEDPIQPYEVPLPTDYWTRPISQELSGWGQIAGNFLGVNAQDIQNYYTTAPETSHIVWTRPMTFGGIAGGKLGDSGYYSGLSYEALWGARSGGQPIILNGKLYYNVDQPPRYGYYCIDLRTGEETWWHNSTGPLTIGAGWVQHSGYYPQLFFGQVFNYDSPNQHGAFAYLWSQYGSTWQMHDAFTGNWILNIENVPSIQGSVSRPGLQRFSDKTGDIQTLAVGPKNAWLGLWSVHRTISYEENLTAKAYAFTPWMWRPYLAQTFDGQNGYIWNVTLSSEIPSTAAVVQVDHENEIIILSTGMSAKGMTQFSLPTSDTFTECGVSFKEGQEGQLLWTKDRPRPSGNVTLINGAVGEGVYTIFVKETLQWYGYDTKTGDLLWGPTESETALHSFIRIGTSSIAYGKFIAADFWGGGGVIYCYDVKTGELVWSHETESLGLEGYWPRNTAVLGFIADKKIYLYTTEHSPGPKLWAGGKTRCLDIETGNELWKIGFWGNQPAVADGYLVDLNNYDNQIYCFGKGQTATTVTAEPAVIADGSSVLIKGTVMDQSPGAKDTPAISDEDMSEWMEYLYMQQPMPMDAIGVKVTLDAIDPNGNFINIGTATSDMNGMFKKMWTPEHEGEYTIIATFEGSKAYYSSYAETAIGVEPAPSPAGPIEPEPSEAPLITTEMAIIVAAVIVAVAVIVGFWIIRKRK